MKEKVLRRKEIRRVLSAVLCLVMCLSLMPTTVFAAEYINKVNITGISDPVAGEIVGDNLDRITTEDSSYVITNKRWWCDTSGHIKQMSSDDVFAEGLEYSLQVYVEPSNSAFYMNEDTVLVFNSGNYATDYYSLLGGTSLIGTTVSKTASLAPKYTVTFNMNGHGTAPAPQTVVKGSRLTEPADPTASGYVFGGWYIDPACQNCYYSYYTIEEDTILYAKWLKNINTVNALGVKAPIAGQKVKDFQNIYIADSGCYLEYAQWMKYGTDNALQDDESFSEGVEYVFKCWVTCKEDSGFAANVTALINDSDVYVAESYPREGGIIIRSVPFTAKENICVNTGNHDFSVKDVTKATLTSNGKIVTKCKDCGEIKSSTTIYYPKTIKLSATAYTYDGKVKKPSVSVVDANGKTIAASNYTVTYASGRKNVGKYTVKVAFKGNYSGTKSLTFKINPVKTTIKTLTKGTRSFKVTWTKKSTQVTGYQIQYSLKSDFSSGNKTVTVKSYKTTSKTIKNLKAKKKYYVRVRTYKAVSGTNYYSGWSAKKYVTTK